MRREVDMSPILRSEGVTLFWLRNVDAELVRAKRMGKESIPPYERSAVEMLETRPRKK